MRKPNKVTSEIDASHPNYERLVEEVLRRANLIGDGGPAVNRGAGAGRFC